MNELEEELAVVYRGTNTDLIKILRQEQSNSFKTKVILFGVVIILSVSVIVISYLSYLSNKQWLEVFNSYEYATVEYEQDGDGINSINSGTIGDLINGAETKD